MTRPAGVLLFSCRFRVQIHSGTSAISTRDRWVERDIALPFVPFQGLEVSDGDWTTFVTEDAQFLYEAEDSTLSICTRDKRHYGTGRPEATDAELEAIVVEYEQGGWVRRDR